MTWQANTFGLVPDKGVLRGSFNSYNFYDSNAGANFLNEIIAHEVETLGGVSIARFLRDNGIELWVEPGRALLDQVGITVARVNSVRESSQGDKLVCLNMKRQDICFIDQEIFVDPIILYQNESAQTSSGELPVYFAGNLCLESDLVTRHQTFIPRLPDAGDLVAFANTAGYFMDFSASEAIMQPIAKKVAVFQRNKCFGWALDENYYPWLGSIKETR
jgi:diaminopimelate decarboxylase